MIPKSLGNMSAMISLDTAGVDTGAALTMRKLQTMQSTLRSKGLLTLGIGLAFAAPLAIASKSFASFEQQMANVSTMVDDTEKHMGRLTQGVTAMSMEFGQGTETISKGLYDILSATIPAEKALGVLSVSARAAIAGVTDTGVAADAITTLLSSYGLGAEHAASMSDLLFGIVKRGKTTFAELAPTIGLVASSAASAGVSVEELGASIATLTRNGVRTANAVTATNAIIMGFMKPTKQAAAYAKDKLGFSLGVATLKAEGLEKVFKRIAHLPPDAIAKLFPNIRALRGLLPALKSMKGFSKDIGLLTARAGMTDAAYKKMSKTLSFAMARVKQSMMAVLVTVGSALAPALMSIGRALAVAAKHVRGFVERNKTLIKVLAVVAVSLISIGTAMLLASGVLMLVTKAVGGLVFIGKALFGVLTLITAHPIIAFVLLLGAAFVYIAGTGDTFMEKLKSIGNVIMTFLTPAISWLKTAFTVAWAAIQTAFKAAVAFLIPVFEAIRTKIREIVVAVVSFLTPVFITLGEVFSQVADTLIAYWQMIGDIIGIVVAAVSEVVTAMVDTLVEAFTTYLMPVLVKVGEFFTWLGGLIQTAFGAAVEWVKGALMDLEFAFLNWRLVSAWILNGFVLFAVSSFWKIIHQIKNIPTYLKWVADNWRDIFQTMWNAIKTFSMNVGKNLAGLWKAIWGFMKGEGWNFKWTGLMDGFENTIKEFPKIAERVIGPVEQSLVDKQKKINAELIAARAAYDKLKAEKDAGRGVPEDTGPEAEETPKVPEAIKLDTSDASPDIAAAVAEGVQAKSSLAGMVEKGSAAAFAAVVKSDSVAKTTARNTSTMVKYQKKAVQLLQEATTKPKVVDLGLS